MAVDNLQPFAPFEAPLSGTSLIEASAGTGKTYTITGLYLRLIVEARKRVDEILVVTFTNAATEELKDRILRRLLDVREAFNSGVSGDDYCQTLLDRNNQEPEREVVLRRLDNAIRGFDEAAIYTIHSFCQRVLRDQAFASGMPFETELRADIRDLQQEIVEDFWRRQFYHASPLLVGYILDKRYSPDSLLQEIRSHLGKPYLNVLGADESATQAKIQKDVEKSFAKAYQQARQSWLEQQTEVQDLLLNDQSLNGNKYRKTSLANWFTAMDRYLEPQLSHLQLFAQFEKFASSRLAAAVKKDKSPPQHVFFDHCEALLEAHTRLEEFYQSHLKVLRVKLLEYCNQELALRKQREQIQSYDDLLSNLQRALRSELGDNLANGIRKRYSAALIDEFQDTDPIQYEIFDTIYGESDCPVFIVGDPKQAIYSFRGADIFAYLQANADANQHFTLDRNWRSEPALIEAVNALFANAEQPFVFSDIRFAPARAAERERTTLRIEDDETAPFQLWFIRAEEDDKTLNKAEANEQAARATAAEIVRLLNLAANGKAFIGDKALEGGDIAVLVRNHRQGQLVRDHLLQLGVPSVQHAQDNVFDSQEALELEYLLNAVVAPGREALVRAALTTHFFGLNANDLYQFSQHETLWEQWLERFYHYNQLWREHGFMRFFKALLYQAEIPKRLLALHDGERRLTNLQHLAELLQSVARQQRLGPEGLLKWYTQRRQSQYSEDEEHQLRLESDEHLVQIVTIHKSKGLEYSIVFCPFLWDGRIWSQHEETLSFHDPDKAFQATLDLGSEQLEEKRGLAKKEELAENLRLLYVALTRAKQRCYMIWGAVNGAGVSAPAWLLHRPKVIDPNKDEVSATQERFQAMTASALLSEVKTIAETAEGAIQVSNLPDSTTAVRYTPPQETAQSFSARQYRGSPPGRGAWRISSFSGLTLHHNVETPDYDTLFRDEPVVAQTAVHDIFNFPRGARAGSCLHKLFEDWDFTDRNQSKLQDLVNKTLAEYGFSDEWSEVITTMVEQVLATPLDNHHQKLRLNTVSSRQRLNEMEFYYPLANLTVNGLNQVLSQHSDYVLQEFREPLAQLTFAPTQGYMKGFIDLIFAAEDKFYIVDYKSNWLGNQPEDYRPQQLTEAMARDDYYLQYLIYTIALHRYLRLRLPNYDYEQHFGGVFYLFLRGMSPQQPDCGVFRDRPAQALIEALDHYLDNALSE